MLSQEIEEVKFWKELLNTDGIAYSNKGFYRLRTIDDLNVKTKYFPGIFKEKGKGLDYGCGLVSIFEQCNLDMDFYDPLLNEYEKLFTLDDRYIKTIDKEYDFICCFNVLDHTPEPFTIINDFKKHLRKDGRLYFEVNFDKELYKNCHHVLMTIELVRLYLKDFKLIKEQMNENYTTSQTIYEGIYEYP